MVISSLVLTLIKTKRKEVAVERQAAVNLHRGRHYGGYCGKVEIDAPHVGRNTARMLSWEHTSAVSTRGYKGTYSYLHGSSLPKDSEGSVQARTQRTTEIEETKFIASKTSGKNLHSRGQRRSSDSQSICYYDDSSEHRPSHVQQPR